MAQENQETQAGNHAPAIDATLQEMDSLLIKAFNDHVLPGLAVGVVRDGKLVYTRSFGFADLEKERPVDADTVFRIMSISKTFTSIGVMQLWEQKKLDLDDPVNPYLKGLTVRHKNPAAPPVTIRNLLTHTAGIGETRGLLDIPRPVVGLGAQPDTRILSMPEYYNGVLSAEINPDEKWSYSNHAFAVLAHLIESQSGEPFDAYMRRHVFEPLGMFRSDYVLSERVRDRLAQGYIWKKDRFVPYPYLRLNTPGCGGIFSSVNEMAHYVSALMNGGANEHGRVLQEETLKRMMTSQLDTDPRVFTMGLGFFLEDFGGHLVAEHSGGWPGFISSMRVVPDAGIAMLAFTNSSSGAPDTITREILHKMLGLESPSEKPKTAPVLQRTELWSQLVGSYSPKPGFLTNFRFWGSMGGEIEVYVKNGQLKMRGLTWPEKRGVALQNVDAANPYFFRGFHEKSVTPVVFHTGASGAVESLSVGSWRLYKQAPQRSLRFKAMTAAGALAGLVLGLLSRALTRKKSS